MKTRIYFDKSKREWSIRIPDIDIFSATNDWHLKNAKAIVFVRKLNSRV